MRSPLLLSAPDHVAFGRLGHARPDAERLGADLDGRVRMGEQVVIPGRVLRRPRLRREDRQALPYPLERERADSLGAGARPGMVQEEDVRAGDRTAHRAAVGPELLDYLAVEVVGCCHDA